MLFRTATEADRPGVEEVLRQSFSRIYARYARKSFANLDKTLVAEDKGKIVAVTNWLLLPAGASRIGYLFWLAVLSPYRRRGVGLALAQESLRIIEAELGPAAIYITVEKDNLPSRRLFAKLGFAVQSRQDFRAKYGKESNRLYQQMMFMPWEELMVRPGR